MDTRFTWDPAKAERNQRNHGISFEMAREAFADPNHIVTENYHFEDEREQRYMAIGMTRNLVLVVGFVLATVLFGTAESHYFLSGANFFDFGLNIGPIALMALPLTFIVMTGEIDLSVASTLGLACSLLGYLDRKSTRLNS